MLEKISPIHQQPKPSKMDEISRLEKLEQRILEKADFITRRCRTLLSRAGRDDMAEEIANEALYKAIRAKEKYEESKGEEGLDPWLSTIARNTVMDWFRKIHRDHIGVESKKAFGLIEVWDLVDKKLNPEELMIEREEKEIREKIFKEALGKLPDKDQTLMQMEFDGLTYEEMAQNLQIPVGTLKSNLFRVRRKMAELLGQDPENLRIIPREQKARKRESAKKPFGRN